MSNKKQDHITIKLPVELVEEIDVLVGKYGFRSRGEVVKEAVRKLLDHYRNITPLHAKAEIEQKNK
ncbi:MAG: ribbon-helix-helix domain-containing protein [Candidatus Bathyarchaeia archaeon]